MQYFRNRCANPAGRRGRPNPASVKVFFLFWFGLGVFLYEGKCGEGLLRGRWGGCLFFSGVKIISIFGGIHGSQTL